MRKSRGSCPEGKGWIFFIQIYFFGAIPRRFYHHRHISCSLNIQKILLHVISEPESGSEGSLTQLFQYLVRNVNEMGSFIYYTTARKVCPLRETFKWRNLWTTLKTSLYDNRAQRQNIFLKILLFYNMRKNWCYACVEWAGRKEKDCCQSSSSRVSKGNMMKIFSSFS